MAIAAACARPGSPPWEAALAGVRCGEGRLTGARWAAPTAIAPKAATTAFGGERNLDPAVLRGGLVAQRQLRTGASAAALRNVAVVMLAAGRIDQAIDKLLQAAALAPRDAGLWNDLAAARLERARRGGGPQETVLALAATDRALNLAPTLCEARFNAAIALERLGLPLQAEKVWRQVLAAERDPSWLREAGERAESLANAPAAPDDARLLQAVTDLVARDAPLAVRPLVAGSPQFFREHVEQALLGAWASAVTAGRPAEARRTLTLARTIANALAVNGDAMTADIVNQIDRESADATGRSTQLAWARWLTDYQQGLDEVKAGHYTAALQRLAAVRGKLADVHSPLAGWATYWIAVCWYQRTRYTEARNLLAEVRTAPANARYKALLGRCAWLEGLIDQIDGRPADSLAALNASIADFDACHETGNRARVESLLATELGNLAQTEDAWRLLGPALLLPSASLTQRIGIVDVASLVAQDMGEPGVALRFQNEAVDCAERLGLPDGELGALRVRAALWAAVGKQGESLQDLARARALLPRVSDPQTRRGLEGDLLLTEGELAMAASPADAIARFDAAIPILGETSFHYWLASALAERADAEFRLHRDDAAERDWQAAIVELERQRQAIEYPDERISFLDRRRNLFNSLIAFELDRRHRPDAALRVSEQAKARVLWDWMLVSPIWDGALRGAAAARSDAPISPQAGLPAATTVVEYAVLPRELVIWAFHGTGKIQSVTLPVAEPTVARMVRELLATVHAGAMDAGRRRMTAASEQLYGLLVAPVASWVGAGDHLVFVPDGALHDLPFALLRSPATHHFLVQDHAISLAPSVRILAGSVKRDAALARAGRRPRALIVAAPSFDRSLGPSLPSLGSGEGEARLAGIFAGSRVLREGAATSRAFLAAAPNFEIVHFGGHSLVDSQTPLLSRLLFAAEAGDASHGGLSSADLLRRRFDRTRLVVLASCSTGTGKISRTEGVENLVRPFLAAGVPVVVASLWPVDDTAAAIFGSFYRHLAERFDAAEALRAAQVELIDRGGDGDGAPPAAWAAFEVFGASAPYWK